MRSVSGVENVHHLHLWQMQEHQSALNAHILIKEGRWNEADRAKEAVKIALCDRFGLSHITLELERHGFECEDVQVVGHISATN